MCVYKKNSVGRKPEAITPHDRRNSMPPSSTSAQSVLFTFFFFFGSDRNEPTSPLSKLISSPNRYTATTK